MATPVLLGDGGDRQRPVPDHIRIVEALLFAAVEPLDEATLSTRLPEGTDIGAVLESLRRHYSGRGVQLARIDGRWAFRTAEDLAPILSEHTVETRKLSRAALETLAIIAYHQPVTRAEIEDVRGVSISKGTLDVLMETGWVRLRGRRRVPGRPVTYGTTAAFLDHFGLDGLADLPGLDELRAAGLLDGRLPPGFAIPTPSDETMLRDDEEPLETPDLSMSFPASELDDDA
jgi:segregation and condensation protein B